MLFKPFLLRHGRGALKQVAELNGLILNGVINPGAADCFCSSYYPSCSHSVSGSRFET